MHGFPGELLDEIGRYEARVGEQPGIDGKTREDVLLDIRNHGLYLSDLLAIRGEHRSAFFESGPCDGARVIGHARILRV